MPDVYKTVVTKANLQYYHGKLERLIDKLGDVKNIEAGSESAYIDTDPMLNVNAAIRQGSFKGSMAINVQNNGKTLNYENENYPGAVIFEEKPTDGAMRIASFYSHAAYNREYTIYNKSSVDSKFTAINGLKFQEVDTNLHPTLEAFTDISRYSITPNVPSEDEQMNPWFWDNLIALYPYDGELLEYVLIWSKDDITTQEWQDGSWSDYASWEFVGSTKQDLTGYLQDGQIEAVDNDYIDYVVDYKYMAEGLYDALGNKVYGYGAQTIIDSSLSAEPIFVANSMMTQVITGVNEAFDPGTNVKTLIVDRNKTYAVDGDNFEGMRNLPRIETLVLKCGMIFAGDCFSGCTDLRRIYVYSETNLTEANLGNCTAKIIKVDP